MEESPAAEDKRLNFIADCVLRTLKVRQDRWEKCASDEDSRQVLQDFLDTAEQRTLMVSVSAAGLLEPATSFAGSRKNKAVYFMKRDKAALSPESIKDRLVYGDLSSAPVDQFSALVGEVVAPLLSNRKNHIKWPHVVTQDIKRHVYSLKTCVLVLSGQVQGKTLLPLPVGFEKLEQIALEADQSGAAADRSIIHSLESAVIEWSHQIRTVLEKDSCEAVLGGKHPTPHAELLFWNNRYADLEYIHSQLNSCKVKKMEALMEAVESSYYPAFVNMQRDVLAALEEAQDICIYLTPLQRLFEEVENMEFPDVKGQIKALMHMVCLVWANSRHYNTPGRLIVLLQETCNLLIQQAKVYLVPEEVLTGEPAESLVRVQTSLEVLRLFRSTYEEHRANLRKYQKNGIMVRPWDFSPVLVFSRLDQFISTLDNIKDILSTYLDLMKLEKLEIGGIRGRALSLQIQSVYQEFLDSYRVFTEKSYDCLDATNTEFEGDVRDFKLKVDDTDCRLGAIFCQAFDDASGLEHTFKVLEMFGSLTEHPLIAIDVVGKYPLLLSLFDKELDSCKQLYNKQMKAIKELGSAPTNKNMPEVSGGLRWAHELQQRIRVPFSKLRHFSPSCLELAEGARVIQNYEEMTQLLDRYSAGAYATWTEAVGENSQHSLSSPLISRDLDTHLISVNFNPQVLMLTSHAVENELGP